MATYRPGDGLTWQATTDRCDLCSTRWGLPPQQRHADQAQDREGGWFRNDVDVDVVDCKGPEDVVPESAAVVVRHKLNAVDAGAEIDLFPDTRRDIVQGDRRAAAKGRDVQVHRWKPGPRCEPSRPCERGQGNHDR